MEWINEAPSAPGKYRWREAPGARVHVVRVTLKRREPQLACSTMDRAALAAGGQWSAVELDEHHDALELA
jgi:hypothetical protein